MCAIAGVYKFTGSAVSNAEFDNLIDTKILSHRGPDDYGVWRGSNCLFQHWRLAVQDLSAAGRQPMLSSDGRFVICFNGEIYNHLEIRSTLLSRCGDSHEESKNVWRGGSDTETIVEAYRILGDTLFPMLNGMFAISIFDIKSGVLKLVRDRYGVKPLYYYNKNKTVLFSSEIKYFYVFDGFNPEYNWRGIQQFLEIGQNDRRNRVLCDVFQLEPGTVLTLMPDGQMQFEKYVIKTSVPKVKRTFSDAKNSLINCLRTAVSRQLVADIPVGLFLSGGVDSTILAYHMAEILGPENTKAFTLSHSSNGGGDSELFRASEVVNQLGIDHCVIRFEKERLVEKIEKFSWFFDEPFGDPAGFNMMVLSEEVKKFVGVALAGEGADEIFGGYRRYRTQILIEKIRRLPFLCQITKRLNSSNFRNLFDRRQQILLRAVSAETLPDRYMEFFKEDSTNMILRKELKSNEVVSSGIFADLFKEHACDSVLSTMCNVDRDSILLNNYFEKSDKGSMASSLEVRVPYLDNDVVEFADSLEDHFKIRGLTGKWLLKMTYEGRIPKSVISGFKTGFSVPLADWFKGPLYSYYNDVVLSKNALSTSILDQKVLEKMLNNNRDGDESCASSLWKALVFELWLKRVNKRFSVCST
jgi:asparagine synthase (glutamine-hydrolysing)